MKSLESYIKEDVFNTNLTTEESLLNTIVGETNGITLIIYKVEGKKIFIGPSDENLKSQKETVICNDSLKELIEGFDINEIYFNYKNVNISCLSGLKKKLKIIGSHELQFNGELENTYISCIVLELYRSEKIKNCKIECDYFRWGNGEYKRERDYLVAADCSDELKVPFENCNIRVKIGLTLYYSYDAWREVRSAHTFRDKNPNDYFGFDNQFKTSYIRCKFDTWSKLHQHSALYLSKNYNNLKKLKLSPPRKSINGWYYVDELMDLDLY